MKKILEAIKNFFSASHERERKGIQATKHGMFNNFVYAVKLTWQLNNQFIIAMIVVGVLSALYMLIGIYIPKIVLALVENKVTTDTMIKVLVAVGIIILVVKLINTKAQNNIVMVHIYKLRRKLEQDCKHPTILKTAWGKGYYIE